MGSQEITTYPKCRQSRGNPLVALMGLADGRVTAGEEHGRPPPGPLVHLPAWLRVGCVDHGGDVYAGDALEHDTLDAVPIELLAADDAGGERRARLGQAAHGVEHRVADLALEREQCRLGRGGIQPRLPHGILGPGAVDLRAQVRRHQPAGLECFAHQQGRLWRLGRGSGAEQRGQAEQGGRHGATARRKGGGRAARESTEHAGRSVRHRCASSSPGILA